MSIMSARRNLPEALSEDRFSEPDVILLDIKMRDGDGFDVVEALAERPNPPAIIFVTAFDHYAVRAFDSAVADYLLKPVERDRLARALREARHELRAIDAEQRLSELHQIVRNLRSVAAGRRSNPFETGVLAAGARPVWCRCRSMRSTASAARTIMSRSTPARARI